MVKCPVAFRGEKAAIVYRDSAGILKYVRRGFGQSSITQSVVTVVCKLGEYSEQACSYEQAKRVVPTILARFDK